MHVNALSDYSIILKLPLTQSHYNIFNRHIIIVNYFHFWYIIEMSKKPELIHSLVIKSINVPPSINGKREAIFFMRRNINLLYSH